MFVFSKRFFAFSMLLTSFLFTSAEAMATQAAVYADFNSVPAHQLTDKISLRFVTSSQLTVIQWNLKAGAKLPLHSHVNEQVTRVLEGNVEVHSGDNVYQLHSGGVMIFPSYVTHSFTAITDTVMYELQTPIRQDFLQPDFIEKLSKYLKENQ